MKSENKFERLDKFLSNNGFGTRKDVKRLIHSGRVKVNESVQTLDDFHIYPGKDEIFVDEEKIDFPCDVVFMLNKPKGYVCSTVSDSHPVVMELIKAEDNLKYPGGKISMVGRLDVDTEGLLLLTSDGLLNHKLTSPKWQIEKEYLVFLRDKISSETKAEYTEKAFKGMHLKAEGKHEECDCKSAKINWLNEEEYNAESCCTIIITEGKFHEIKRIFSALGNEVVYLKRIRMNKLELDKSLKSGEYRKLNEAELLLLEKDI